MSNCQKIPGLDRVEKYLGLLKSPESWSLLHLSPRWFFFFSNFHIVFERANHLSLPQEKGLVTNYVRCCQGAVSLHPTPTPPFFSVFRNEIISFGANYRWRMLGMCKATSSEPSPPIITGCTLLGWAGTGGWMSGPKFNPRVCEGHAFLNHSSDLLS